MERPYVEQELINLKQADLISLVRRQQDKWPFKPGKITKAKKEDLRNILLDPTHGFTTDAAALPAAVAVPSAPNLFASFPPPNTLPSGLVPNNNSPAPGPTSTSQRIQVNLVDRDDCAEEEWRANALEILQALQSSIGRIAGSGRIGVPDPLNAVYTVYFVEMIANKPIAGLATNPELLTIPKDGRLNLRVIDIAQSQAYSQPHVAPSAEPSAAASVTPGSGSRSRVKELSIREMDWLKGQLSSRPGYTKFDANHNKVLQNVDRVSYWRFASSAKQDLHKRKWPADMGSSKKITLDAIYQALGMKSTAFTEAVQMTKIIDIYTAAGVQYSPEVAAEVAKADEPDPNGRTLWNFLLQWDKDHGSVLNEDDG
ncbi:hypothetical protein DFH06DRAFT_1433671 [Mycena polygramma]|nr:hypothetical protein DFH06DRAFT_1433671 [Mycena polygramma]